MTSTLTLDYQSRLDISNLIDELIDAIPEGRSRLKVSEHAEQNRILPEGTPKPGAWDNSITPFFVEPMDCLSASSPIRELAMVKPAQIGATAALVENFIAYIIQCNPAPTLYVTANDKLLKQWNDTRLIPLLKSYGLENILTAQAVIGRNTRTGVTTHFKEFPGGVLGTATGHSDASLRSNAYCNIILDEITAYAISASGKGDPSGLARARTTNYPLRKKIVNLSTPGDLGSCQITKLFERGDQCFWFVPCPFCNEMIVLEFSKEYSPYHEKVDLLEKEFGLVWDMKGRQLDENSIGYRCVHCQNVFKESKKWSMVQQGLWKPTETSVSKTFRSFQLSGLPSLLSPWKDTIVEWLACDEDENAKKAFVTTKLGIPYKVTSAKPRFASLLSLRGNYNEREIQAGTLFLTAAVDVQQGSRTNPDNPPRLEMEVLGHGLRERTWSVEYKKFIGSISDPNSGAWEQLFQYVQNSFKYLRFDGYSFTPTIGLIDARSGVVTKTVCDFCNRLDFWFPSMSHSKDIKLSDDDEIVDTPKARDNVVPYRESKSGDNMIYLLSPNYFKRQVYRKLNVERQQGFQKYGFCEFPKSYDEIYFKGLTSEDLTIEGVFVKKRNIPNEPLDIRAYNEAAARIYLDMMIKNRREFFIKKRKWDHQLARTLINSKFVLELLETQTKIKKEES